ncbi:hypothetical protein SAMN04488020_102144 [Palleronia marisminoris]|uniref:Uncharacterized protein n=1 Tax=Palleronia marisminoris TaxID=315423 RepID=A0A1Y5S2K0_9RHOB|nr:hypothetical protein [Palleronia marisminoris]SFG40989.1 hypothetical protein SAMN04488020_102144 [Palleronia marisminoris]SLN28502.1 hypothetical protein PAM7066_01136 [Palleronia marisminoris]
MARPQITLSEAQRAEVETLAALLSQEQIADYFGIARNTFRAICDREPEVLARYKRGKAKAIAHVANGLLQKARSGCTTSSIFYLKTQAGWRETAEIQHSGGASIEHKGKASDAIARMLDQIAERKARIGVDRVTEAGADETRS